MLPDICSFCGDQTGLTPAICDACVSTLPRNDVCCPRCANPTPSRGLCPECLNGRPRFANTLSPFLYVDATRALVSSAKFHRNLGAAACMGHLLGRHVAEMIDTLPDVVVPVPLHTSRLRVRGYNQALEMTRVIKHYLPVSVRPGLCQRIVPTVAQSSLESLTLRRRNVRRAFSVRNVPAGTNQVVLVDDVMTTGSTLAEISRCFSQAGVPRVDIWVFARATRTKNSYKSIG